MSMLECVVSAIPVVVSWDRDAVHEIWRVGVICAKAALHVRFVLTWKSHENELWLTTRRWKSLLMFDRGITTNNVRRIIEYNNLL